MFRVLGCTTRSGLIGSLLRVKCDEIISRLIGAASRIEKKNCVSKMSSIKIVPALEDNYMYILMDEKSRECAVVDAVEPEKVLNEVKAAGGILMAVLTTHHHWDHAGGNEKLHELEPEVSVYGGDSRIQPSTLIRVGHNDTIKVGGMTIRCLFTPCHTSGHICYYVEGGVNHTPAVFTGDTLFAAGCGKFFEGTKEQMHAALIDVLSALPSETRVYCGHEYTVNNLKFALHVEPENKDASSKLSWALEQRKSGVPTIPTTIAEEKLINPFMRVNESSVKQFANTQDPVNAMGYLRSAKDNFKPNL